MSAAKGSGLSAAPSRRHTAAARADDAPDRLEEIAARIRVIIAEDGLITREFLVAVLGAEPELEIVAVCRDGIELAAAVEDAAPDVIVTNIRLPPPSADEGLRLATRLRATDPVMGIVVLSRHADPDEVLAFLGGGTARRAYLLQQELRDKKEVVAAIKAVARGDSVIDPKVIEVLIKARSDATQSPLSRLTPREHEVLAEIASGKSNAAIADKLVLTQRAIEKHVNSILAKLDLRDTEDISRRVMATLIYIAEEKSAA
jgi:DNA-binding NarL/FixJ family response regulator